VPGPRLPCRRPSPGAAGQRLPTLVDTRLLLVLGAAGTARAVSLAVTAAVFQPRQWAVYAAGNALLAATFALIGVLLGPVFGRISSVFLVAWVSRAGPGTGVSAAAGR